MEIDPYKSPMFKDELKRLEEERQKIERKIKTRDREEKSKRIDRFFKRNNCDAKLIQKQWQRMNHNIIEKVKLFLFCMDVVNHEVNNCDEKLKEIYKSYIHLFNTEFVNGLEYWINEYERTKFNHALDMLKNIVTGFERLMSSFIIFVLDDTSVLKGYEFGEMEEEEFIV